MIEFFESQKSKIQFFLADFLKQRATELSDVNPWGGDACRRLEEFSSRGKMIRGGLLMLSGLLFKDTPGGAPVQAAGAVELLQSAFLIHDDIMDQDETRRGQPTLFSQYNQLGEREAISEARRLGESLSMCVGDISFFLMVEILTGLDTPVAIKQKLLNLCAREITSTCTAQMQDVYWGYYRGDVSEEEIMGLYLHKTGRYTFSLPLLLGGLLTTQGQGTLNQLEKLGEIEGVVFQIKDDELGLFGTEEQIGKPVGSDIREAKRTLFYHHLVRSTSDEQRDNLANIFGCHDLRTDDIAYVRNLIEELGIRKELHNRAADLTDQAQSLLSDLPGVRSEYREILQQFIGYNLNRTA